MCLRGDQRRNIDFVEFKRMIMNIMNGKLEVTESGVQETVLGAFGYVHVIILFICMYPCMYVR